MPVRVPKSPELGKNFQTLVENEVLLHMDSASDTLFRVEELAKVIQDHADDQRRITMLAEVIAQLAHESGSLLDYAHEQLRNEHLPLLVAALPKGGEA